MSASSSKCLLLTLFYLFFKIAVVSSNGILTHIVISYRTLTYFGGIQPSSIDYGKLIDKHHDALLSGSVFPDVFYNDQCAKGNYSFASDDAHWAPFLNTTLNYINTKYPKPWDDSTEKLVVFTMGMLSHQVADVLWNSYGIQQGFISTMANLNFHGSVADAMKFGELGGDVIADYDLNMGFIQPFTDWYVPVDDLVNIYNAFYGSERLPRLVIQNCSTTMLFSIIKEKAGISEYFIELAPESPFMVNQMFDYFLGGVDSSAGWVHRKWSDAAIMLENGTSTCTVPRNPLFINCDKKKKSYVDDDSLLDGHHMNHVFSLLSRDGHNYDPKDVEVNRTLRGITMRPSKHYRIQIEKEMLETTYLIEKKYPHRKPIDKNLDPYNEDLGLDYTGVYYVNSSYAKLGWATEVGDVDGDSYADMIIGAPCYGEVGAPQQGRVFFVYGTKEELPGFGYIEVNLDNTTVNCTNFIKSPSLDQIRFGSSVALLDINLDGVIDVAVGAPSYSNTDPLQFNGAVFIYYGTAKNRAFTTPNITITCQSQFCNLGYSLTVADVDSNGHSDLVIGSPFYSVTANQSGIVSALLSRAEYSKNQTILFEDLLKYWSIKGKQMYGWLGHNIRAKDDVLMVSQPQYRKCGRSDCKLSNNDTQAVGDLTIINFGTKVKMPNISLGGLFEFNMIGYSSDFGYPYDNTSVILAVGAPGAAVDGNIFSIPMKFKHAGTVVLFNVTMDGRATEVAHFDGDRDFGKFGEFVKFDDINNDGYDDLLIGAPTRTDDWTGLSPRFFNLAEDGRLYVFNGGQRFPTGNVTYTDSCDIIAPCPDRIANETILPVSPKGNIGYNAAVLKYANMTNIIATSLRSSDFYFGFPSTGSLNVFRYNHTIPT